MTEIQNFFKKSMNGLLSIGMIFTEHVEKDKKTSKYIHHCYY